MNDIDPRFADLGPAAPKRPKPVWYKRKGVLITAGVVGALIAIGALVPAEEEGEAVAAQTTAPKPTPDIVAQALKDWAARDSDPDYYKAAEPSGNTYCRGVFIGLGDDGIDMFGRTRDVIELIIDDEANYGDYNELDRLSGLAGATQKTKECKRCNKSGDDLATDLDNGLTLVALSPIAPTMSDADLKDLSAKLRGFDLLADGMS